MNKKLLCSTALAGALISGAAFAELKVGGDITHTINLGSNQAASTATNAGERLGTEMNLKLSSKADLNNGWYISYSGKLEIDDSQGATGNYDHEYEIQLGQGNFYIGAGSDAGNNISASPTLPVVGYQIGTLAVNVGPYSPLNYDGLLGVSANGSPGLGSEANNTSHLSLNYKVAGGIVSYIYSPNNHATNKSDDDHAGLNSSGGGSAYAILYQGSPVANTNFIIGRNVTKGETATTAGSEYTNDKIGVSYNFGKFAAGVEYQTQENDNKSTDDNVWNYAVSMKASDTLTFGLQYSVAEAGGTGDATAPKEKIKAISAGYNLGAASIAVSLIDGQDVGNAQGQDVQGAVITTRFNF